MRANIKMHSRPRPRRADEEEEDESNEGGVRPFKMKNLPIATAWKCHVNQPFMDVRQFQDLVEVLEMARAGDSVEIKLSTPGGSLESVLPLLSAMATTNAQVFVHAVSDVASAGTFLLMMADDVYINPYTTIMFHQVSYGAYGIGNHVEDRVTYVSKASKQLLGDLYQNFLTLDELEKLFQGKEFWMDKNEFDARYKARLEVATKMAKKMQKPRAKKPTAPVEE